MYSSAPIGNTREELKLFLSMASHASGGKFSEADVRVGWDRLWSLNQPDCCRLAYWVSDEQTGNRVACFVLLSVSESLYQNHLSEMKSLHDLGSLAPLEDRHSALNEAEWKSMQHGTGLVLWFLALCWNDRWAEPGDAFTHLRPVVVKAARGLNLRSLVMTPLKAHSLRLLRTEKHMISGLSAWGALRVLRRTLQQQFALVRIDRERVKKPASNYWLHDILFRGYDRIDTSNLMLKPRERRLLDAIYHCGTDLDRVAFSLGVTKRTVKDQIGTLANDPSLTAMLKTSGTSDSELSSLTNVELLSRVVQAFPFLRFPF